MRDVQGIRRRLSWINQTMDLINGNIFHQHHGKQSECILMRGTFLTFRECLVVIYPLVLRDVKEIPVLR